MGLDKSSCANCAKNYGVIGRDLPCEAVYRSGNETGRPQINLADPGKLGKNCPLTRPFKEVYQATSGGFDMDQWSQSIFKKALQDLPRNWNPNSDLNQEQLARKARYTFDSSTGWHGYNRSNDNRHYPVLCYNPQYPAQVRFVKNNLIGKVIPNDSKMWVGFCGRYEGTAGMGNDGGGSEDRFQTGDMVGAVVRLGTLLNKTERAVFLAKTTAAKTTGAHIIGGAYLVVITGLEDPSKLSGQKFGGTDVNIVFGVSAAALKHGAKAKKYASIATKLLSGADTIERWEKIEIFNLAQRYGGLATQAAGGLDNLNINVVDVGATTGMGISYNEWEGKIDYVSTK